MAYFSVFAFLFIVVILPVSSQLNNQLFFSGFNQNQNNSHLSLTGSSQITKNGILRLTNETSRLMGHAFYSSPFQFKNSTISPKVFSFSTSFAFSIVPEYPKLGGHGLAFTISTSQNLKALPSQYLGLLNSTDVGNFTNHLLAVEFDTVQDFEFGDIDDNHVGIDINSLRSNASASAAYYTQTNNNNNSFLKQDLNLKDGSKILVWIDYDSVQNLLNVTISPNPDKPILPILSFPVDLTPIFEDYMYVGFSASTGLLASSHYILGWSFKINGQAPALDLSSLPSVPTTSEKKHISFIIGVSVLSALIAITAISLAIFHFVRKIRNAEVIEDWELQIGPHRYSYKELKKATNGFSDKQLLGQGGFGKVYKGTLPDSEIPVAVKRISNDSSQGLQEFVSEIGSVGRLRHRNLAQLLGWCRRKDDFLLVYEFMSNGSLDKFIFDQPKLVLSWPQRFKIIKDVAFGLLYLHEGYEQVVIHRDVKASNVLLDSELNGKLGDFGLARLYEHGSNPSTTRVVGTLGYLAPELPRTGKATASSDVYAFGAVLLEVACGRRPVEPKALPEEMVLVDWVWERYKEGRIIDVVDKRLNGEYNESEIVMVIKLGIMCSNNVASARPSMRQIVRYLDGEISVSENLMAPHEGGGGGGGGGGKGIIEFEDLVDSFASSSFNKMSSMEHGDVGTTFPSISTSPLSLLHVEEEAR